jgi:hypothetical protein
MAMILSELLADTRSQFQLTLLAGADALDVPVNWVHLVEDAAVAPYFWGGELVVTTGVGQTGDHWLLELLQQLHQYQCSGVIINTGMYLTDIPQEAVDFCDRVGLALLTMPWHIHLSEVIKLYCMRIVLAGQNDAAISKAVINAIETPNDEDRYLPTLLDYYNTDGTFQAIAFRVDYPGDMELSRRLRTADVLRTLLSRTIRKFTLMRYEDFFVLVLNDADEATANEVADQLLRRCGNHAPPLPVHIGIGSQVDTVQKLHNSYRRARAAARMADYFKRDLVHFRDMGIYQLLFTAEDPDILEGFYRDNLGTLEDYDRLHNSSLLDTLYYDLLTGGSIKAVAEAMYTHRNTVNYRLGKIRELLGTDLNDADERTRYRMAFYARDILQKMWQTRDSRLASQDGPGKEELP